MAETQYLITSKKTTKKSPPPTKNFTAHYQLS